MELLRAVARMAGADEMRALAGRVEDWDALARAAEKHRVAPAVYLRSHDMGPSVPAEVLERLRTEYHRNVFHTTANAAELIAVLRAFEEQQIPAMPFKGVVLGASVYGDPTKRNAGDLDLLIRLRDLKRASALLAARGYECTTANEPSEDLRGYCYEHHFERRTDGMVLETRWMLEMTPKFGAKLDLDWVWQHRRVTTLAGAEVPDIGPEVLLLLLCMHGSKHVWERLLWICDVAELLRSHPQLDWEAVMTQGRRVGLGRALALGTLLAHRVAGAEAPAAVLAKFRADPVAAQLAEHFDRNLFHAPGSSPEGKIPYHVQLLDARDRLRLLLSFEVLRPNERDRAFVALPESLRALYYVVRPLRLLRDRSAR